jgi:hypothetical protein
MIALAAAAAYRIRVGQAVTSLFRVPPVLCEVPGQRAMVIGFITDVTEVVQQLR